MRRALLASCVAALVLSGSVEAASVRSLARMQRAAVAPAVSEAAVPALGAPEISALCLAKCAAEVVWCIHECDHPGLLGGCKEDCAGKGAECTAMCVLAPEPMPTPTPEPTPVHAVAPTAASVIDSSNIQAAFDQLATASSSSSQVSAPSTVDWKCLAECAANGATCIYNCYPSFGLLGGCKENCAADAGLCTAECVLKPDPTPPTPVTPPTTDVMDVAAQAVALVVAVPAAPASSAVVSVGAPAISAVCMAKCAAEVAYCIYECVHPKKGLLGGCKITCAEKAAECAAVCALVPLAAPAPAAVPAIAAAEEEVTVVNAQNVEAFFASHNQLAVVPSPVGPLSMPNVDYKCLAKCAAECAYCIYECLHPKGMLGGCKENCAATAAECSAECVLEEQSSEATAVIASSQKAVALVVASPAVAVAPVDNQLAVPTKCLAECAARAALCIWDCEHPSFGLLGGCKENCAAAAAECSTECVLKVSAPVVNSDNVQATFDSLNAASSPLLPVLLSAVAVADSKEVAVSAPNVDYKCLGLCATKCAYCIYECLHPAPGLWGGCKEDCAATAAECSAECVLEEPSSAKAVLTAATKAVALIEVPAPSTELEVAAPMTAVCLAKCAAEAAYCVYECDHPSFGLLGGCKEDCAGDAAICSAKCVLALPAPAAPVAPVVAAPVVAPVVVAEAAVVPAGSSVGAPEISALCLAKCAAEVTWCIHECDHPSGLLGGCKEDCALKGAECTAKCVL